MSITRERTTDLKGEWMPFVNLLHLPPKTVQCSTKALTKARHPFVPLRFFMN